MSMPIHARTTIGVTGSSGLVGSALIPYLIGQGHHVLPIRRQTNGLGFEIDPADAVVHLAGEPIASNRWNRAKKIRIRDSRVDGTRSLCQALIQLDRPPRVLICASAVGYYGDRGSEYVDEKSGPGHGFLADVAQEWEQATQPAVQCGIRVVCLRFGMILSRHGGALSHMLRPFRFGLGGRIGDGRQYWSWISLDDALGAIGHVFMNDGIVGPVNVVAPNAVTNAEFTATLGRVLKRPTWATMPAWAIQAVFGQMGNELLLASTRVVPRRLMESGYAFRHAELEDALRFITKRD
jgi:uncharacterized protein (TIGR01777 family)